ncbi:MAG: glycosyltransferase family 2 protein [Nevskia sp.]|nr:glycosyltransferase family 2 protein [Nevskia sp.]
MSRNPPPVPLARNGVFPPFYPPQPRIVAGAEHLPRITVVTPSYNQAAYLEATIRSVLEQGYPNLEYIVIDGGSTDGSRDILEYYGPWLSHWVSERDSGQTEAILKGFTRATGEWFNWINSDDLLAPGALWRIAGFGDDVDAVAGLTQEFRGNAEQRLTACHGLDVKQLLFEKLEGHVSWHQPSIWLRRSRMDASMLNPRLHYRFDYELLLRYLNRHPRVRYLEDALAYFRLHPDSKTISQIDRFLPEHLDVLRRLSAEPEFAPWRDRIALALRRWQWLEQLDALLDDRATSRWRRIARLVVEASRDRPARCFKPTRRAVRRLLLRGGKRTKSG